MIKTVLKSCRTKRKEADRMTELLDHAKLGFCLWDIIPIVLLAAVIIVFFIKRSKMKKEEKELLEELKAFDSDKTKKGGKDD